MNGFDRSLCWRSFAFTLISLGIAFGVVVVTDEPFSTSAMRLARLCAFAPALGAVGAAVAVARARSRGELRALLALGATPWRAARGAAIAAWGFGVLAVILLLSPYTDPAALFPAVTPVSWHRAGAGLVEHESGVYVEASGELSFATLRGFMDGGYEPSHGAAALAIAPLALVVPAWITTPVRLRQRLVIATLAALATILLLHGVAARQLPPATLLLTCAPVVLQALWLRWRLGRR
jgi:hypothetical protein